MLIHSIRHDWPEKAGFLISRPTGLPQYTFLHFINPVQLRTGRETVLTKPGACIFYRPDTPQWFYSDTDLIHNWAHFQPELDKKLTQYQIPQDEIFYPGDCAFISDLFHLLEMEYFLENLHKEALMAHLTEEFLLRLARAVHTEQSPAPGGHREKAMLRQIRQQILSAPEEQWNVSRMAARLHLSASRFHCIYKAQFGTSPTQDLIDARIARGKSLLLAYPELDLTQIAEKLGYNDQYHFIRQFKSRTGQTPGAYRKKLNKY